MPLQTTAFSGARVLFLAAVTPPGNAVREVAIYRRSLFAALGEATALAYPCAVPLAFMAPTRGHAGLARALGGAWRGAEGAFTSTGLAEGPPGAYYLGVSGPLQALARGLGGLLPAGLPFVAAPDAPLACALGFFLCLRRPGSPVPPQPPSLAFSDCALSLYRLEFGDGPWAAMRWTCVARAERRPGRPLRPSASL